MPPHSKVSPLDLMLAAADLSFPNGRALHLRALAHGLCYVQQYLLYVKEGVKECNGIDMRFSAERDEVSRKLSASTIFLGAILNGCVIAELPDGTEPTDDMGFASTEFKDSILKQLQTTLHSLTSYKEPEQELVITFNILVNFWKHYLPDQLLPTGYDIGSESHEFDFKVLLSTNFEAQPYDSQSASGSGDAPSASPSPAAPSLSTMPMDIPTGSGDAPTSGTGDANRVSKTLQLGNQLESGPLLHDLIIPAFNLAYSILEYLHTKYSLDLPNDLAPIRCWEPTMPQVRDHEFAVKVTERHRERGIVAMAQGDMACRVSIVGNNLTAQDASSSITLKALEENSLPIGPAEEVMGSGDKQGSEQDGDDMGAKGGCKQHGQQAGSNEVIALYFSGHWGPSSCGLVSNLASVLHLSQDGHAAAKVKVVFVSNDPKKFVNATPYQTFPCKIEDASEEDNANARRNAMAKLYGILNVRGIPTLVIVDGNTGKLITASGSGAVGSNMDREDLPRRFKEIMKGATLVEPGPSTLVGPGPSTPVPALERLRGKVTLLYFAASWCSDCRAFTPKLVKAVKKLKDERQAVEAVYVSRDQHEAVMKEYHSRMVWPALSFRSLKENMELNILFKVQSIPTLVVLDESFAVITEKGVSLVEDDLNGTRFPWKP